MCEPLSPPSRRLSPALITALTLAGLTLAAAPAAAQTIVLGEGYGADCYRNAVRGDSSRQALEECDRAVEQVALNRDLAATYINRAIIKVKRQEYESALADVEAAARRHDFPEVACTRGVVYFHTGRMPEAVEQFTAAIESGEMAEPEKAHYNRGLAFELMDMAPEAYADYMAALELNPDFAEAERALTRFTVVRQGAPGS